MLTATYFHVLDGNSYNESEIHFVQINNTPQTTYTPFTTSYYSKASGFGIHARNRYSPNVLVKTVN